MIRLCFIGGGAASVISSIYIKKHDINNKIDITILEKDDVILKKILKTGNGHCNFYNDEIKEECFFTSSNKDIIKNIIKYDNKTKDFLLNELLIEYNLKDKLYYPRSNQSKVFRRLLVDYINYYNINVICNYNVEKVTKNNNKILVNNLEFDYLIFSCGSKAKSNFDNNIYNIIKSLNINIIDSKPALVPVISNYKYMNLLNGVRFDSKIKLYSNNKLLKEEIGQLQFNKNNLSGICMFNLSILIVNELSKNNKVYALVDFLYNSNIDYYKYIDSLKEFSIFNVISRLVNENICLTVLKELRIDKNSIVKTLSKDKIDSIYKLLTSFRFDIIDYESFNRAQSSIGGVSLNEVNNNLESIKNKNIFFIGEILDICGICGGFNLANAFMSGIIVGDKIINDNYK